MILKTDTEKVVDLCLIDAEKLFNEMLGVHRRCFRRVWESAQTPDEVLAGFGRRGTGFLSMSWQVVQMLLTVKPDSLTESQYMPRRVIIYNEDGSVTLEPPPEGYDAWGRPIQTDEPER